MSQARRQPLAVDHQQARDEKGDVIQRQRQQVDVDSRRQHVVVQEDSNGQAVTHNAHKANDTSGNTHQVEKHLQSIPGL